MPLVKNTKQVDYISINSFSNSEENHSEKIKVSNKINLMKNQLSLLSNYLPSHELTVEKTSSSETSSLNSYELEFENDVKLIIIKTVEKQYTNEFSLTGEEFKVEEIVSKIKTLKKVVRNKSYHPILINYTEFKKVILF